MFVAWVALSGCHPKTDLCAKRVERKRRRLEIEEAWAGVETPFWEYGRTLTSMESFMYLVLLLMFT